MAMAGIPAGKGKIIAAADVCPSSRVHWRIKCSRFTDRKEEKVKIVQYLQIGACLKIFRMNAGISQKQMADRLKLSAATYSNYENGYSNPTIEIIQEFCAVVGTGTNDFLKYAVDRVSRNGSGKLSKF